jgi:AcrR family transcriptional regulator
VSPKTLTSEQRRALTVETVLSLAGRRNPSEITTAAIAERMSVSQGALFRHFPSKDAIWQAVMQWVADRLLDRIDRAAASSVSPIDALRQMFLSHLAFVNEHPGLPRMMFGELQHAKASPAKKIARTIIDNYAERLAVHIEAAKAAGAISADTNSRAAAILFIGTIQGLVMQSMISGNLKSVRDEADAVFTIYLRGLGSQEKSRRVPAVRRPRADREGS